MADIVKPRKKKWALYVFFGANVPEAELRAAAVQNLLQMATVGSSGHVAVAAELHLPGPLAYRYVMPSRPPGSDPGVLTPVDQIPNRNSADPRTILEFFKWANKVCPAQEIMLVVWGHGYGLDDYLPLGAGPHQSSPPLPYPCGKHLVAKAEEEQSANFAAEVAAARYSRATLMNVIWDHCNNEVIPNNQLGSAAGSCHTSLPAGQELSILAIDACAMAMIEVWSELKDCAQIGIASEAQEPDASFPYDRFLARLHREPDARPKRVAQMMIDAYVESYAHLSDEFVTLSACYLSHPEDLTEESYPSYGPSETDDPAELDEAAEGDDAEPDDEAVQPNALSSPPALPLDDLLASIKELAEVLKGIVVDCPLERVAIFRARNASPIFDQDGFMDLARFCEILRFTMADKHLRRACKRVGKAVKRFVAYARYSPLDPTLRISQSTGLSIWFPPWLEDPSIGIPEQEASIAYLINGYGNTTFACRTGWHLFLMSLWRIARCDEASGEKSLI